MARNYGELVAYLAGSRQRLEENADETKGHALAAMGAAADAKKDAAATREMVEAIVEAMGIKLPQRGGPMQLPAMRDRAVSSQDLEAFTERLEGAVEKLNDRATPVFAFPVPGMGMTDATTVRRTEMTSERVRGTVSEVLDKIELDEVRKTRGRREKIADDVKGEIAKWIVLAILGATLTLLLGHLVWH